MIKSFCVGLISVLISTAANAECPEKSPSIKEWAVLNSGDQRVNAGWLQKNLAGRRVKFDDGTEHYESDGRYYYESGSQRWDAPSYKFYDTGFRCIDYSRPRFDMYVVKDGQLVLINSSGNRLVGKILK